jgi:mannosyltransferase OCH1-like enzyme
MRIVTLCALCALLGVFVVLYVVLSSTMASRGEKSCLVDRGVAPWHKVIYMTTRDKSVVPKKIMDDLAKYAPGYTLRLFDDSDCLAYLRRHFGPQHEKRFLTMEMGAHKADLWRYCVLFKEGGIYMDIKTRLTRPVSEMFPHLDRGDTCYSVWSYNGKPYTYQGIIAAPPNNKVLLEQIQYVLATPNRHVAADYQVFTKAFGRSVLRNNASPHWVMFQEDCFFPSVKCTNPDRYGMCCEIRRAGDQDIVVYTRHPDYGKTWFS